MSNSSTNGLAVDPVWDPFKNIIRTLYLDRNLSLEEIRREMATTHQFDATKAQYELHFKKWEFRKNRTADEWKTIAHKIAKRKREHRDSEVRLNGILINQKKLRKETLRYGSMSATTETTSQTPLPPTPKGFIIRTPSPKVATPAPAPFCYIPTPVTTGFVLTDCLPFYQFISIFSQEGNPLSRISGSSGSASVVLLHDICSSILGEFKAADGKKVLGPLNKAVKSLMPENVFASNPAVVDMPILQGKVSSVLDFLKLTMYLVSNNFFEATSDVSRKVYNWVKHRSNVGLLEYLLSIGGPTMEALVENLFRLAIDADDVHTVKQLMDLGIDSNEQVYCTSRGSYETPIQRACKMRSLELVRVLINGGAKVNLSAGEGNAASALTLAVDHTDESGPDKMMEHVDIELVRVLLHAGAAVNPGFGQSPLAQAALAGHVELVTLLISEGADVHFLDGDYCTPLMSAVQCDLDIPERDVISIVRILHQAGADPRVMAQFDIAVVMTVLEEAIYRKSVELIQLLLDNGALVTESAFVTAAKCCDLTMTKLLLKSGAQVTEEVLGSAVENDEPGLVSFLLEAADDEVKNRGKRAALVKAIEFGKIDLIDWLDASGAQLNSNLELTTAIQSAAKRGDMRVLSLLLSSNSRHRVIAVESLGTSLRASMLNGRNDIVELLLAAGADVNADCTEPYQTPLLIAIGQKDLHLVRKLLAAGAAVNGSHRFQNCNIPWTVLPAAVTWGYYPLIRDIINAGAEVNTPGCSGETALFVAVQKKHSTIIKFLIDAGANVNNVAAASYGRTALRAASQNNDVDMVRYLLSLGADPDEWSLVTAVSGSVELLQTLLAARLNRKGWGCRALQYAIRLKNVVVIEILLANGIGANTIIRQKFQDDIEPAPISYNRSWSPAICYGESALGSAIMTDKSDDLWIVQMLLRGGADPNSTVADRAMNSKAVTAEPQTALLVAIGQNNLALVRMLIVAGADANSSTIPGISRTPLQMAVERGSTDIVHLLLEHGADVNAPPYDRYGATALQFAAIGGYVGIALLLLERGADVNASPAKVGGRTALEGAAEHGRIDMLQLLLNAGAQIIGLGVEQYERAREFASKNGHISARRLLETYNAQILEDSVAWDLTSTDFGFLDNFHF